MATGDLRKVCGGPIALSLAILIAGCGPAQIGPDREAFRAVDALYTAVSLREAAPLARSAATLKRLNESERLPSPAYRSLEAIIQEAESGRWEAAQARLARFMEGQRR